MIVSTLDIRNSHYLADTSFHLIQLYHDYYFINCADLIKLFGSGKKKRYEIAEKGFLLLMQLKEN